MKNKRIRIIGYCLVTLLILFSSGLANGCSCNAVPATVTVTATPASTTASGPIQVALPTATPAASAKLSSISISPTILLNIQVGNTQQFIAIGHYANGSVANITSQVTWASSDISVATVISPGGLVTGVAGGTTEITANLSGVTSNSIILPVVPHINSSFTPTGMNGVNQ